MDPIRGSQATRSTQVAQPSAVQQLSATQFKRHFVLGDGDCLFRALRMGQSNKTSDQVSRQEVMDLRNAAAAYVTDNHAALIAHTSFGGNAGVNNLQGLLLTQGQWNDDTGDLVAPILAQVLGREVRILKPTEQGRSYEVNDNRIFRPQDPSFPVGRPDTGQPPVYLAHIGGTHYEYLEPNDSQADATSRSTQTRLLPSSIEFRSEDSGFASMPSNRVRDRFMSGQEKCSTEDVARSPSSDVSSSGSMSTGRWFDELGREEESSLADDLDPPARKKPRSARLRPEQKGMLAKRRSNPLLGKKQVRSTMARTKIMNAFTQAANGHAFGALSKDQQNAEVVRISEETGYAPFGVLTTLTGGGNRTVAGQVARTEIKEAFSQVNERAFEELTSDKKRAEVARISRATGYRPAGIWSTLNGGGNMRVETRVARNQIKKAFANAVDKPTFDVLTLEEQRAEVLRIAQETGYNRSGIRTTLAGGGNMRARSNTAKINIINAFTKANKQAFDLLEKDKQRDEVIRVSRETGYSQPGVRAALTGGAKPATQTPTHQNDTRGPSTKANKQAVGVPRQDEQRAEAIGVSRETGHSQSTIQRALTDEGKHTVRIATHKAEIMDSFSKANNRTFDVLTEDQQYDEVVRLSQETGLSRSDVLITLIESVSDTDTAAVRPPTKEAEIMDSFSKVNNRAFEALTEDQQYDEVVRISQETGHSRSDVLVTLIESVAGNTAVRLPTKEAEIMDSFSKVNNRAFEALTEDQQYNEVVRISQETGHSRSDVLIALIGSVEAVN